jgi:hypothetical protein
MNPTTLPTAAAALCLATMAAAQPAPKPAPSGPAIYPTVIAAKYAKESPGKGRRATCLDQYKTNKTSEGNGGLSWIQKGGGYYSACSKKLKSKGK